MNRNPEKSRNQEPSPITLLLAIILGFAVETRLPATDWQILLSNRFDVSRTASRALRVSLAKNGCQSSLLRIPDNRLAFLEIPPLGTELLAITSSGVSKASIAGYYLDDPDAPEVRSGSVFFSVCSTMTAHFTKYRQNVWLLTPSGFDARRLRVVSPRIVDSRGQVNPLKWIELARQNLDTLLSPDILTGLLQERSRPNRALTKEHFRKGLYGYFRPLGLDYGKVEGASLRVVELQPQDTANHTCLAMVLLNERPRMLAAMNDIIVFELDGEFYLACTTSRTLHSGNTGRELFRVDPAGIHRVQSDFALAD